MKLWGRLDATRSLHRGLISLMHRLPRKLKPDQAIRLKEYFQEHPTIEAVYRFKQMLHALLYKKSQTARQCRRHAQVFAAMLEQLKGKRPG